MESITTWFEREQRESPLAKEESVKVIPLSEAHDWAVRDDGTIRREDGEYYHGVMVQVKKGNAPAYDRLMLRSASNTKIPPIETHGIIVLIRFQGRYLVQAKSAEGSKASGRVALAPTIQASYKSLKGAVPYADYIDLVKHWYHILQDPDVHFEQSNKFGFLDFGNYERKDNWKVRVYNHFFLATRQEIALAVQRGWVNSEFAQILGMLYLSD